MIGARVTARTTADPRLRDRLRQANGVHAFSASTEVRIVLVGIGSAQGFHWRDDRRSQETGARSGFDLDLLEKQRLSGGMVPRGGLSLIPFNTSKIKYL